MDLSSFNPTSNPDELVGQCPDCGKVKLYVNTRKRVGYCQRCHRSYRSRDLLRLSSLSDEECLGNNRGNAQGDIYRLSSRFHVAHGSFAYREVDRFPNLVAYLRRREVSLAEARELRLGGREGHDGECAIGFQTHGETVTERRITNPNERGTDWNPPGPKRFWMVDASSVRAHKEISSSSRMLLHGVQEKKSFRRTSVLVEGPFDAIRVWQCGVVAQIASCQGSQVPWGAIGDLGDIQAILILFDNDPVGRAQGEKEALRASLGGYPCLSIGHRLPAKDPGESDLIQLRELIESGLQELSLGDRARMRDQVDSVRQGRASKRKTHTDR